MTNLYACGYDEAFHFFSLGFPYISIPPALLHTASGPAIFEISLGDSKICWQESKLLSCSR